MITLGSNWTITMKCLNLVLCILMKHRWMRLYAGQVGYLITGMKTVKEARVGDTLYHTKDPVTPFPGFKPAKPMVFAGIFPVDTSEFDTIT